MADSLTKQGVVIDATLENADVCVLGIDGMKCDSLVDAVLESGKPIVVLVRTNVGRKLIPSTLEASPLFDSWCNYGSPAKFVPLVERLLASEWTRSTSDAKGKIIARMTQRKDLTLRQIQEMKERHATALRQAQHDQHDAAAAKARTAEAHELVARREMELSDEKMKISEAAAERARRAFNVPSAARGICAVCFDAEVNTAFVPCGHECCCCDCATVFASGICPICRRSVDSVLRVYRVASDD